MTYKACILCNLTECGFFFFFLVKEVRGKGEVTTMWNVEVGHETTNSPIAGRHA